MKPTVQIQVDADMIWFIVTYQWQLSCYCRGAQSLHICTWSALLFVFMYAWLIEWFLQ